MEQNEPKMKKNPLAIFIGLALATGLVLAGVTKDRWYKTAPQTVAETPAAPAEPAQPETPAVETQQATAPAVEQPAEAAAAPAAEQPAAPAAEVTVTPAAPAAEVTVTPTAEAPGFDTVRIEKTGEAVIAGRAIAGSEVVIKLNGQPIGTAVANEDGKFVIVPDMPLPAGTGALTIEIKPAGTAAYMPAGETVAVAVPEGEQQQVMAAVVSQDQPTQVLQAPAAVETAPAQPETAAPVEAPAAPAMTVSLDAVDYDSQGNIMFSGRGTAGGTVRLYVDNAPVGESQSGADGRWSFVGAAQIAPGNHTLRVDEIDAAGAVASRVELPFFREEAAKVAAAEPEAPAAAAPEAQPEVPAAEAPATETEVAAAAAPDAPPRDGRVVIQPGNNLWRISQVIYGDGDKYTVIYAANKKFIRDPDLIYPGQIFTTPEVLPPEKIDPRRRAPLAPGEGQAAAQ